MRSSLLRIPDVGSGSSVCLLMLSPKLHWIRFSSRGVAVFASMRRLTELQCIRCASGHSCLPILKYSTLACAFCE